MQSHRDSTCEMAQSLAVPQIEVYIVPSTALAAGSLVNAIYAATKKRIYSLPVRPEQLRG